MTASLGIPAEKIDVAAPGYDTEIYKPLPPEQIAAFKQKNGLPERFWFFLGTLEPRKNLTTLIDAYAMLPKAERLPLILAGGKGWLYDDIFAAVDRYNLVNEVHFPGYLPVEDLAFWYNSAEVFVYPSVFEGFGLPVLEAMACGTPVILSMRRRCRKWRAMRVYACRRTISRRGRMPATGLSGCGGRTEASRQGLIDAGRYRWLQTAEATVESYQKALEKL